MTPSKRKILIIEDDQLTANVYRNKFQAAGYQVEVAADGQSGFYSAMQLRPDAILLDLLLPQLSGLEILKKLRGQGQFQKLPIVVLTNGFLSEIAQSAKAYANKVFDKAKAKPQDLLEAVDEILSLAEKTAAAAKESAAFKTTASAENERASIASSMAGQSGSSGTASNASGASASTFAAPVADSSARAKDTPPTSNDFIAGMSATLSCLRQLLRSYTTTRGLANRQQSLLEITRHVHGLASQAGAFGFHSLSHFSSALEALLCELHAKPEHINPSTDRTLAYALDSLGTISRNLADQPNLERSSTHILVIDDQVVCRKAVSSALAKVQLHHVAVGDATTAMKLLAENEFDLIILDVRLPDVEGFDLCKKIRALPDHKKTPVIFVTGANDLESRARSIISGGNDFICKPFMLLELSVKALAQVINYRRLKEQASSTPNQPSPSGTASDSAVEDGGVVSDVFPNRSSGASK